MNRETDGRVPYDKIENVPGCGMAIYAGLLGLFLVAGITGIVLATAQLVQAGNEAGPTKLRPGSQLAVWQMEPMRSAGLVKVDEIPLAWHDESPFQDGTAACALMDDRLIQVKEEVGRTLPYARIDSLSYTGSPEAGDVVTAVGTGPQGDPTTIACGFGPHEGGTRLLKQLEVEQERAKASVGVVEDQVDP